MNISLDASTRNTKLSLPVTLYSETKQGDSSLESVSLGSDLNNQFDETT